MRRQTAAPSLVSLWVLGLDGLILRRSARSCNGKGRGGRQGWRLSDRRDRMEDHDSPRVFVPPPLLFLVALGAGILVDGNLHDWTDVTQPTQALGLGVSLAGLALILASLGLFRRFRTRPEPWEAASTLIDTGLYRFSRNPMYLGMALTSFGITIVFESIAAAVLVALAVVAIDRIVIAREERYLSRRFGEDYAAYRAKVKRWL